MYSAPTDAHVAGSSIPCPHACTSPEVGSLPAAGMAGAAGSGSAAGSAEGVSSVVVLVLVVANAVELVDVTDDVDVMVVLGVESPPLPHPASARTIHDKKLSFLISKYFPENYARR